MRKYVVVVVCLLAAVVVTLPATGTPAAVPGYLIDVSFVKLDGERYECRAVVKDLSTNVVVMRPTVTAELDREAIATSDTEHKDGSIVRSRLRVRMAADGRSATVSFDRSRGSETMSSQQLVVRFASITE